MKRPTRFEAIYDSLSRIDPAGITEESKAQLRQALGSSISLHAAKASEIAGNAGLQEMVPDLISAFERFSVDGARNDKQCSAKTAVADALNNLDYYGDSVFIAGADYVQMEPVWGGQADTAVQLRSACLFGLARIEHPDAYYILTDHLADAEKPVRIASVKALTYLGTSQSELLLRLKALSGDAEAEVIAECFTGLMTITPDRSLDFVARYVQSPDTTTADSAALAIGNSRHTRAYDILRGCWDDDISPTSRRRLLLPLALVRSTESLDFLLQIVRTADPKTAAATVSVLSIYADDDSISKIAQAAACSNHQETAEAFRREFGRDAD